MQKIPTKLNIIGRQRMITTIITTLAMAPIRIIILTTTNSTPTPIPTIVPAMAITPIAIMAPTEQRTS